MATRYKLKLKRLDFISPVDVPAQGTARVLLMKRRQSGFELDEGSFAEVKKLDDSLGLVFCWAFTSKAAGEDYFDAHNDNIDEDFIKVCADFMEGARAVDTMHDGVKKGAVTFGMPMTPEIAKSFLGIDVDTHGFMVAIKPSAEDYAKFKSGEFTGVSIAGLGIREEIPSVAKVAKRSALTTATNGHSHLLSAIDEMQAGTTSYASSSGSEYSSHSHPWIRHDDGTVTIGEADGHTHALVGATEKREAITSKSTTATPAPTVGSTTPPEPPMTTDADKITALEKRNAAIAKMVTLALTLPETHRAHAATLAADEVEPFLAKSFTERDAIVKATIDADPEVYKTAAGISIRKSQGPLMEQLARQNDANAVELEKARTSGVVALLKARAKTDIGHLAGDEVTKVAALRAIDTIADETERNAVTAMLKGADAAMAELAKAKGVNPGEDPLAAVAGDKNAAFAALEKGLTTFAKANNITKNVWTDGLAQYTATPEGAALNKAYRDAPSAQ